MSGSSAWKPVLALAACFTLLAAPAAHAAWSPAFAPFVAYEARTGFPVSVAAGDVNGDGRADALVGTLGFRDDQPDNRLLVLPQLSDGSLGRGSALKLSGDRSDPLGIAAGDLDGDGRTDVAAATAAGGDLFLQRSGHLTALKPLLVNRAEQVVIDELTGDGRPDLLVRAHTRIVLLAAKSDGSYARQTLATGAYRAIATGDVNHDGRRD